MGLALSLVDYEDLHHFKIIEKKNKLRLEREQVAGFAVNQANVDAAQALKNEKANGKTRRHGQEKEQKSKS